MVSVTAIPGGGIAIVALVVVVAAVAIVFVLVAAVVVEDAIGQAMEDGVRDISETKWCSLRGSRADLKH